MSNYEELLKRADGLAQDGHVEEAISAYREAIEEAPDQGSAYYNLALLHHSQGHTVEAIANFEKVLEITPRDASVFNNLGVLYYAGEVLDRAEQSFLKAIGIDDQYVDAIYGLGKVHFKQHRIYDAILDFQRCLQIRPDFERAASMLRQCEEKRDLAEVKEQYKHILIVMDQGIGNMVMLTPTIRAIKKQLPETHLTVLGRQPSVQVIAGWDMVERVLTQPEDGSYDIGFLTIWSQNYNKLYGERIRRQCKTVYTIAMDDVDTHEADHYLKIARLLGYVGPRPEPFCMVKDVDLDVSSGKKLVGLSDTTLNNGEWERKRWPYYPELAKRLLEEGYAVVLIGGTGEAERFNPEDWPDGVINALGKYDVQKTAGLIKRCDLFIGNDSGPAHMSAALGMKTFVIFGATRTAKNRPYGEDVTIVSKHLSCSPCQYTPRWLSCTDWRCMRDLSVDDVLNAVFNDDALKPVAKDYSSCEVIREGYFPYIQKGTVKERIKIHLVGARWSNFPWGMENEMFRSFEKMGYEVFDTDYRQQRGQFAELFLRDAHLMLVFKGSGIPPELIRRVRCPAVLWYQDDIFVTGHGRRDIAYNGAAFDIVYSFDTCALDEYRKYGIKDVRWLPLAMSPAVHRKMYLPKKYDVSFVGTLFPNRKRLIERLRKRFDMFVAMAYMDEMVKIFNESKIVLNLGVGPTGIQSRVFEALGCGSFLLTNEIPESSRLFEDRKHLVYFNEENIEDLIAYYLEHEDEREEIAQNGYLEVHAKHTYDHRVHSVLSDLGLEESVWALSRGSKAIVAAAPPAERPRKRLLVFWHGIGDNIMATPALRAFRKKHPNDHIGYMYLRRIHKDKLMEGCPYVDALYTCSDAWDDYPDYETGVRSVIAEAKEVARREGYDEIIPVTMRACSLERHRIDRTAYELGVELKDRDTELWISERERDRAAQIFKAWDLREDDLVIAIHRRGANAHKYWDIEEAQKFVDHMRERYGAKFIAFETHTDLDRERGGQFEGEGVFSTADSEDVSLKLSAALIERCDLFVGIDSGPMWLATTTKTPMVALFTMTWMHQSAPMRKDSFIVCSQRAWEMATLAFREEHRARILRDPTGGERISAKTVIEAVERFCRERLPQKEVKAAPAITPKRRPIKVPAFLHQPGSYWAAFLTLKCTASCSYCIQRIDPEGLERARRVESLPGREWVRILNALEHRPGQPLAVTGGEPSLHPDFLHILNHLEGYRITVTTNLISPIFKDVDELADRLRPRSPVRVNTSFHPGFISVEDFTERIKRMRERGLWVDQIAMVDHPGSDFERYREEFARRGVPLRPQSFLGRWDGKLYPNPEDPSVANDPGEHGITDLRLYREGFSAERRSPILCRTARFLIAPDGTVYNCHYHLYSRRCSVGHLPEGKLLLPEEFFRCGDFGFCNPCDYPHVAFRRGESPMSSNSEVYGPDYFWKSEARTRYVFEPMARYLKVVFEPARALDAGCGAGFLIKWLGNFGVEAYGCDISRYAIQHVSDEKYLTPNRLDIRDSVLVADVEGLPYADHTFDLVTCLDVFEHLDPEQAKRAIRELERVTSEYLFMIITVHDEPDKDLILPKGAKDDPTHVTVASEEYWRQLFAQETHLIHRRDLEELSRRDLGRILPWTFFVYEKDRREVRISGSEHSGDGEERIWQTNVRLPVSGY